MFVYLICSSLFHCNCSLDYHLSHCWDYEGFEKTIGNIWVEENYRVIPRWNDLNSFSLEAAQDTLPSLLILGFRRILMLFFLAHERTSLRL